MSTHVITKANAIALFTELGFKNAAGWDDVKWGHKLEKIADTIDGADIASAPVKAVADEITAALKEGKSVVIEGVGAKKAEKAVPKAEKKAEAKKAEKPAVKEPKAEKKPVAEKAEKAPVAKKKEAAPVQTEHPVVVKAAEAAAKSVKKDKAAAKDAKTEKPAKKAEKPAGEEPKKGGKLVSSKRGPSLDPSYYDRTAAAGTDRFGYRTGTTAAKINATLGKKWKETDAIEAETSIRRIIITDQLLRLIKRGLVEKSADRRSYRLTEAGAACETPKAVKAEKKAVVEKPAAKAEKPAKKEAAPVAKKKDAPAAPSKKEKSQPAKKKAGK